MHYLKKAVQKAKIQVQKMLVSQMRWGSWLQALKITLALVLLGGIVLKLMLGRPSVVTLQGEVMCTPYRIQYLDKWGRNYQKEIDALLIQLHQSLSISLADSELSRFNEHDCSEFYFESPFFYPVVARSKEVYRNTAGAFDPTILPLINAWKDNPVNTTESTSLPPVSALCAYVNLDYIVANTQRIKKLKEGVKLDFGGILKGYAVDEIASLLRSHGIEQAWIALGSTVVVNGKLNRHKFWYTPIHPYLSELVGDTLQITIELADKALAISSLSAKPSTSHIRFIDPKTGYPAHHNLLAAAVVAPDGMAADAYATVMMVRGPEYAQQLLEEQTELAAFLIYEDAHGELAFYASSGLHVHQNTDCITLKLIQEPA